MEGSGLCAAMHGESKRGGDEAWFALLLNAAWKLVVPLMGREKEGKRSSRDHWSVNARASLAKLRHSSLGHALG